MNTEEMDKYNLGSLKVEDIGIGKLISSSLRPEDHEKHIQEIKAKRPEIKSNINKNIQEIVQLIEEYNPFELLTSISLKNLIFDPETYKETTHPGKESHVEYALSLILAIHRKKVGKPTTDEIINKFDHLISEIVDDLIWYFLTEASEGKEDKIKEEIRAMSIAKFISVRGDSYEEHYFDLLKDLFEIHDSFLQEHFNLNIGHIISGVKNIRTQINYNVNKNIDFMGRIKELHSLFIDFIENDDLDGLSEEEIRNKYLQLPEVQEKNKGLNGLNKQCKDSPFIIRTKDKNMEILLKLLSANFGDNSLFLSFEKAPGWPTNDSIINEKPIIAHEGVYYCFDPNILVRNMREILESWIREKDKSYFEGHYQKKRSLFLENKALDYFRAIFPEAEIYNKLFYHLVQDGENKRPETDGIIIYDNNIFIIEAKSGSFSLSARRGGLKAIERDMDKLIDDAYCQAMRTKKYIDETDEPCFEYENGSEALIIKNKHKFKNIFLINITLVSLDYFSTRLSSLKTFDLIQGKEWPWSVFINDLRIISELIEFPSEFILYLKQRVNMDEYSSFRAFDELDVFMYYLNHNLEFKGHELPNTVIYPQGYTEPLDRYYDYIAGRVSTGKKPELNISIEYKELLIEIEKTKKFGRTEVATQLLNLNSEIQEIILLNIEKIRKELELNKNHNYYFIIYSDEYKIGITFLVTNHENYDLSTVKKCCKMEMYKTHLEEWIQLNLTLKKYKVTVEDFNIYNQKWRHNPRTDKELRKFKGLGFAGFRLVGSKIGNNAICPCGSGVKYKSCCKLIK